MTFCLSRNAMAMAYLQAHQWHAETVWPVSCQTMCSGSKLLMAPTLQQLSSQQMCGQKPGQTLSAPAAGHSMALGLNMLQQSGRA